MAVRSTRISGTRTHQESLAVKMWAACQRTFADVCTLRAALRWHSAPASADRLRTHMSQPIITDRLLAETIGVLWVLTKHAELHQVDARQIDRATTIRQQLERIQQLRQG